MELYRIETETRTITTGRKRDGSDRRTVTSTIYRAVTSAGAAEFDHMPTDEEIVAAFPTVRELPRPGDPTLATIAQRLTTIETKVDEVRTREARA